MEVLYQLSYAGLMAAVPGPCCGLGTMPLILERETGLEPATLSLEG